MKTIGERIRELREDKDLSLRELASKLGVSAAFMSDVELGRRQPSDKHLALLARLLGTTPSDLKQHDTRPPLQEMRRMSTANPEYGFAFRQLIDRKISSKELLEFLKDRDKKRGGRGGGQT